jgi:DnaK suppressor protein
MKKQKRETFKVVLTDLRKQTVGKYERTVQTSGEEFSGSELPDPNDEASRTIARRILLQISEKNHSLVNRIDEALDRVDDGSYGDCLECGDPIPDGRLELVPYTEFCVACQEKIEKEEREK